MVGAITIAISVPAADRYLGADIFEGRDQFNLFSPGLNILCKDFPTGCRQQGEYEQYDIIYYMVFHIKTLL